MPVIPTVISREDVRVGGIDVYTNAQQAGAGIGRELQGLGESLGGLSRTIAAQAREQKAKDDNFAVANAVAQTDLAQPALSAQENAPADGAGLADSTFKAQKEHIDKTADELFPNDNERRQEYKTRMYAKLPGWRDRATGIEFAQKEKYRTDESNTSITSLVNKVRVDPMQYDQALKDAEGVIDAGGYAEAAKVTMKTQLRSDLAGARFEAFMGEAESDEDFVRLEKELKDEYWQKQMSQAEFDRTAQALKVSRNAFLNGQDSKARAMLDSMENRSTAREIIPDEEMMEMGKTARASGSPGVQARAAKIENQQRLLKTYGDASPQQIDQAVREQRETPEVKGDVGRWASDASQATGGEISASYLINKLGIEYSAKDIREGRYNEYNKAGTSKARGLFQFIPGTWLSMMKKYGARVGIDTRGMDPEQILNLRGDPALSTKMAAFYALENKRAMQAAGINPTDTDLYLAHFLGSGGAISFLQAMRADPSGPVRPFGNFGADQISANLPVFTKGRAGARTMRSYQEVYQSLGAKMAPGVSSAKFEGIQYLEGMRDNKQKAVNADPIRQYMNDGRMGDYALDSFDALRTRGADAAAAASYYMIPNNEMKPLTAEEADNFKKFFSDGDANAQIQALQHLAGLDAGAPGMMQAALNQIGEKDTVVGYAASVAYDKGEQSVGADIIRGNNLLKSDKTLKDAFGEPSEATQAFYEAVGPSLSGVSPQMRDAIFNAAKAYYAQTFAARGNPAFNKQMFQQAVSKVMGTREGETVGDVNGSKIVLPPGISSDQFELAWENMDDNMMAAMSEDQVPPKDRFGEPVSAQDISDEGVFEWIGQNKYKVRMADGGYLTTGEADPAAPFVLRAFIFVAEPTQMRSLAKAERKPMSPGANMPAYDPNTALVSPEAAGMIDNLIGAEQ